MSVTEGRGVADNPLTVGFGESLTGLEGDPEDEIEGELLGFVLIVGVADAVATPSASVRAPPLTRGEVGAPTPTDSLTEQPLNTKLTSTNNA